MKYLQVEDLIYINQQVIEAGNGIVGIRDTRLIDSAINRPRATFDQKNLRKKEDEKANCPDDLTHSIQTGFFLRAINGFCMQYFESLFEIVQYGADALTQNVEQKRDFRTDIEFSQPHRRGYC